MLVTYFPLFSLLNPSLFHFSPIPFHSFQPTYSSLPPSHYPSQYLCFISFPWPLSFLPPISPFFHTTHNLSNSLYTHSFLSSTFHTHPLLPPSFQKHSFLRPFTSYFSPLPLLYPSHTLKITYSLLPPPCPKYLCSLPLPSTPFLPPRYSDWFYLRFALSN